MKTVHPGKIIEGIKKFSPQQKILFYSYTIIIAALFLYSFTQIDLSLTFSRITFLRNLVKSFQYIGYFNRPLSTYLFLGLISSLYVFYILFLKLVQGKKLNKQFIWTIIGFTAVILTFAYNAFSYDLFNYIFDAKIVTHYHQNPYDHKALDYPGDPMLSFMRWTHRVYPYGPVWLVLTVPLSFIGLNLFLPTFFLFKLLMTLSYLGSLWYISKIFKKFAPEKELLGLVFFGLNPLVLVEGLVSAHVDMVMIFFSLWSFYVLLEKKYWLALVLLAISIGIKFVTAFLLPVYILVIILQRRKKINWELVFLCAVVLLAATVYFASSRTNFQPWYLLVPLSFAVFFADKYYVFLPSVIISFFALMTYVPYLYTGNWDKPIPQNLATMYMISYLLSALSVVTCFIIKKIKKHNN